MPSHFYNTAARDLLSGTLNLGDNTVRVMLITGSSVYDPVREDDVVSAVAGADALAGELSVTGYTPGYSSASRLELTNANKVFTTDDADDEGVFDSADLTWSSLGTGSTISGAALIIEDFLGASGDDTETRLVAFLELATPVPTNGSDFTLQFAAEGIVNANVTLT